MNYDPNTRHWNPGQIVLHDADEKSPRMVMRVVGYRQNGVALCRYVCVSEGRNLRKLLANDVIYLHDPEPFGIRQAWGADPSFDWAMAHLEWLRVRRWNHRHKPGVVVLATTGEASRTTFTLNKAYLDGRANAVVDLADGGRWLLRLVEAKKDQRFYA